MYFPHELTPLTFAAPTGKTAGEQVTVTLTATPRNGTPTRLLTTTLTLQTITLSGIEVTVAKVVMVDTLLRQYLTDNNLPACNLTATIDTETHDLGTIIQYPATTAHHHASDLRRNFLHPFTDNRHKHTYAGATEYAAYCVATGQIYQLILTLFTSEGDEIAIPLPRNSYEQQAAIQANQDTAGTEGYPQQLATALCQSPELIWEDTNDTIHQLDFTPWMNYIYKHNHDFVAGGGNTARGYDCTGALIEIDLTQTINYAVITLTQQDTTHTTAYLISHRHEANPPVTIQFPGPYGLPWTISTPKPIELTRQIDTTTALGLSNTDTLTHLPTSLTLEDTITLTTPPQRRKEEERNLAFLLGSAHQPHQLIYRPSTADTTATDAAQERTIDVLLKKNTFEYSPNNPRRAPIVTLEYKPANPYQDLEF